MNITALALSGLHYQSGLCFPWLYVGPVVLLSYVGVMPHFLQCNPPLLEMSVFCLLLSRAGQAMEVV